MYTSAIYVSYMYAKQPTETPEHPQLSFSSLEAATGGSSGSRRSTPLLDPLLDPPLDTTARSTKKIAFKNENEETVLTTYRIVTGCTFHLKSQTTSRTLSRTVAISAGIIRNFCSILFKRPAILALPQ